MRETIRILGIEVGSASPLFLVVLAIHVVAALVAVTTGATAAFAHKGGVLHVRTGRWYYRSILIVFATASALAVMRWREDYQLVAIGAVAVIAATFGYRHRRQHRPGDAPHISGMGLSYIALLTAFYVDNGPHLPLWDRLPTAAFWLLPSVVGTPLLLRSLTKTRQAGTSTDVEPPAAR